MDKIAVVNFRSGEHTVIPYVVVPVADCLAGLVEVIVGPTPLPKIAKLAAVRYLESRVRQGELRVERPVVVESKIPFRRV